MDPLTTLVVGGGMISQDVILPTLLQERRRGNHGEVWLASRTAGTVAKCAKQFGGKIDRLFPDPKRTPKDKSVPDSYQAALDELPPGSCVMVATPDHLHTPVVLDAIAAGHHCVVQKPLCLKVKEARKITVLADKLGAYVLTDYHKRYDPAIRAARHRFRKGDLGDMLHGHAWCEEKKLMALDVFSRWCEESSPFEYIGVHYADAYYYITGLLPRRVSAFGQKKFLPTKGKDAFDAVQAVIEWEDGSAFWVQTSWALPDSNSALTAQGLTLLGTKGEYWADHRNRNCRFVTDDKGYEDFNPNFFKTYDSFEPDAATDVWGYGYASIVQGLDDIRELRRRTTGKTAAEALRTRRAFLKSIAPKRALPDQALVGVAINEAVRLSIAQRNRYVTFDRGLNPH